MPVPSSFATLSGSGPSSVIKTRLLIWTSLFTALMVFGAQLRVPLPVVPFSLQTFFVMLSGGLLGPFYGAASQLLYLALGLAGLPVFARGGGVAYVFQPTFGYLLGFPLASFVAGALIHGWRARVPVMPPLPISKLVLYNVLATGIILACGVLYLWGHAHAVLEADMRFSRALWLGAIIFLPGDLVKIFAASYLYRVLQPRLPMGIISREAGP